MFANNLLVASEAYSRELLRFEQPPALCDTLTRPMAEEVNGNVYVRATATGATTEKPLVVMSPAATESCLATYTSLDAFRRGAPAFEKSGQQLDLTPRSIFKGPDLGRYQLLRELPARPGNVTLPAPVREALGWSESDAQTAGAFPARP